MASSSNQTEEGVLNFLDRESSDTKYMVGFVEGRVVGTEHFSGKVAGRGMVTLSREPFNRFDRNAFKVCNSSGEQVGYLQKDMSAKLAPYVDDGSIIVSGIVPSGSKSRYQIPFQVYIFTEREFIKERLQTLRDAGLNVIATGDEAFSTGESLAVKEALYGTSGKELQKKIDDIFMSLNLNKNRRSMMPSEIVTTELMQHQKEALAWMVHRENSSEIAPFWKVSEERPDSKVYKNLLTNSETAERPLLRGGIFADDMGMGKTLSLLALIATNRPGAILPEMINLGEKTEDYLVKDCKIRDQKGKRNGKTKIHTGKKRLKGDRSQKELEEMPPKSEESQCARENVADVPQDPAGPKATLVVCPPTVLGNWVDQLEQHTKKGSLKVHLFHGPRRIKDAKTLSQFDLVLTSYGTLAYEFDSVCRPLLEVEWLRVILDEALSIRNTITWQSLAAVELKAERRWAVTGTPMQYSANDLFSMMRFLRFRPFADWNFWTSFIQRPLIQRRKNAQNRLRALMEVIMLRRTKETKIKGQLLVTLPPKAVHIHYVELSPEEHKNYNAIEKEGKAYVNSLIHAGSLLEHYATVLQIIIQLRQVCDDFTLCPEDAKKLMSSFPSRDVLSKPDLLQKLLSILQDGEDDFECPVCLNAPVDAVITICSHIFCKACIETVLEVMNKRCPMCRKQLLPSDVFSSPTVNESAKPDQNDSKEISSKARTLLSLLKESRKKTPHKKSVIFSQFPRMLDRLESPLLDEGFKFVRIDGSVAPKQRQAVLAEFTSSKADSPTLLLATLKVAGVGLNLTVASDIYLLEPWWNPAAEEQAINRIYRIGQTNPVNVVRLIVRDSIEEQILLLQEKKRSLASSSFEFSLDRQKQFDVRVQDIQLLMRL